MFIRRIQRTSPFLILLTLSLISSVSGTSVCPYEPFPLDFLRNGGIWHIQGEFYMDLTAQTTVPILIEYPGTYIRLSLQNFTGYTTHATITDSRSAGAASSPLLTTDALGHLSGVLSDAGNYTLTIYGDPISSAGGVLTSCPHGYIEFFARPHSVMLSELTFYSTQKECANTSLLPEIDLEEIENVHYVSDEHIDEGQDYYVIPDVTAQHIAEPWSFTVPSDPESSYTFSANLRTEFGAGGNIRLLLQTNYSDSNAFPSNVTDCVKRGKCFIGNKVHLNSETLTTLLPPGTYALWLYWGNADATSTSTAATTGCIPFGLTLDIEPSGLVEGFIDCGARALPASLNGMGSEVVDDAGRLHLHRAVLLESLKNERSTTVAISTRSYLRVHVTSDTAADIYIIVTNADTKALIESTYRKFGETTSDPSTSAPLALSAIVDQGSYKISFVGQAAEACSSFDLDLAVTPVADVADFCADTPQTVLPDLSGMSSLSSAEGEFHFADGNSGFVHIYKAQGGSSIKHKQATILEQEFSMTTAKMFWARIGSNFVLNDITMTIENVATGELMHPRHGGPSTQTFDLFLYPGTYVFRILSGLVQNAFDYTEYPACALYTLSMDVVPMHTMTTAGLLCGAYRELPASLSDAEWLGTSDTAFTLEEFRVPTLTQTGSSASTRLTGRSEAAISVDRTSYLRVYVTGLDANLDVDLRLYNESTPLAVSASGSGNDESVSYILEPDTDYSIALMFTYNQAGGSEYSSVCLTYKMELMVAPYSEDEVNFCTSTKVPTSEAVFANSSVLDSAFDHIDTYWMPRGTNDNVMARLSFEARQSVHFRAIVLGDFLYSQLALRLDGYSGSSSSAAKGKLIRGGWEVAVDTLPAGNYTLVIYAPYGASSIPEGPLRSACIETLLHIGAEPVYVEKSTSAASLANCKYTSVPATFNTPGFVHMLTEQHAVINGRYRANVDDGYDLIDMNFDEETIYRVLIPDARKGSALDVDITLYEGTSEILGKVVDKSDNAESADVLYGTLQPGTYVLKFSYYGTATSHLYGGCLSFPIYAEFAPLEAYEATETCADITRPGELAFDRKVTETCRWSPSAATQYVSESPFIVMSDAARVRIELATNEFVPGGLTFHITGRTSYGLLEVAARTDAAAGAGGRAWLDEYLLSGTYSLYITDLASRAVHGAVARVGCAEYNLTYHINTTVDPESEGVCTVAEALPTDLYTAYGGSVEYGGPQAEDGTVLVAGEHFLLPHDAQDSVRWTEVMLAEPSFIRVFVHALSPNEIDMFLYRDRNNASSFIDFSLSFDEYGNSLWYVDPSDIAADEDDVSTVLHVQTRVYNEDVTRPCNYFQWAVAVRPRSKAALDIACPAVLPLEAERVPPETVRITEAGTAVPSSSNYVLTSKFVDTHSEDYFFRYRMTLDASKVASASVTVDLSFNFLLSNLQLVLRDYETQERLAVGASESLPNRHGSLSFRNTLAFVISQGKYYLDIYEDIEGKETFLNTTYCIPFDFTMTVHSIIPAKSTSESDSSSSSSSYFADAKPEITYVNPQSVWGIEPCGNLYIDVHFSERPTNVPSTGLTAFLNGQSMLVMSEGSGAPTLPIDYAVLSENSEDDWVIGLRYAGDLLELAHTYTLHVNASAFLSAKDVPFTDPAAAAGAKYQYIMATCNCSGHGTCTVTGIASECLHCDCEDPWTGLECSACKSGYHISSDGSTCVPDPVCGPDSCSGHGTCDASTGSIVCTCDTGYATPSSSSSTGTSDSPCSACAVGYTGYPSCTYDAAAAGANCADPLLPASLGAVPYMGWKGYVDIAGTFHVDMNALSHDIEFELERDSLFRVYAVPNSDFDVDLWLYEVDQDGSLTPVAFEVSMESAEAMFQTLSGGPSGEVATKYLLRMRYYAWDDYFGTASATTGSTCETIDLSLSIAPVDAMQAAFGEMAERCAAEDDLPSIPFAEISDNASYAPEHNFTVRSVQTFALEPRYFWSHDFVVAAQGYHTIMLQAHVGSRFLPGQVTMMLERFPDSAAEPDHCADGSERCVVGEGTLNGHFLHRALQAGKYRLWLLEPALQDAALTNCSLFDFSFRVEYLDVTEAVFECDGNTGSGTVGDLPASLNAPGFLDDASGSVHLNDRFAIYGNASTVAFDLGERSHFRVATAGSDETLFAVCTDNGTCTSYASEHLHVLDAGSYVMHVKQPITWHDGRTYKCITIALELAIEPVSRVAVAPCPASASEPDPPAVLPSFEARGAPFSYGTDASTGEYMEFVAAAPYRAVTSRVAQYTIEITESSTFDAAVMSSFLYHSLGMTLYYVVSGSQLHVASSACAYNAQRLRALLIPGTYLLTLDASELARPDTLPTCIPFNFELKILPFSDESATCELSGEPIPPSFNGHRFGDGVSGSFNFLSAEFRATYGLVGMGTSRVPINITAQSSLINVYVAPNSNVDIDIALLNSKGNVIATGIDETTTEESISIVVPKGNYTLLIYQWNWGDTPLSGCQTFVMQVSVTPDYAPQSCPSTSTEEEEWPPEYPEEIENEYEYTSGTSELWYRQRAESQVARAYRFHLNHASDFAAQTRYTFQTGHLGLVLQRLAKDEETGTTVIAETHHSDHGNGRSTLKALEIPAGDYVLTIYEPTNATNETAGCNHFGFTTIVRRKRAHYLTEDMVLPATLDSIPYLGFDHSMHTQDTFVLFRGRDREETLFTIYRQSIAHIHAILQTEYVRSKFLNLTIERVGESSTNDVVVAEGTTEVHVALEPGKYRLAIINNGEVLEMEGGGVLSDIEISIQPVDKMREVVAAAPRPATCADSLVPPITISPEGYYFYDGGDDALAVSYATFAKGNRTRIQRLKLEVKLPSRVYAQIGYEYALGNLELEIATISASGDRAVGVQQRNFNTLRAALEPGTYYLDILNPTPPPALKEPLEYCFPFTFVISVVPASKGGSGGGCLFKDAVPWDLNRYDGGSIRFGGPIDATGSLLLYGSTFAVPAGVTASEMAFSVAEDSAVSVLLTTGTGLKSIHAHLYDAATRKLINPLGSAELLSGSQQLITFMATGTATNSSSSSSSYYIVLHYGDVSGDCAEFAMQVEIKPLALLKAALVCDEWFEPAELPAQTIVPDDHGFARDLRASAFYYDDPIAPPGIPYDIALALNTTSKVVTSLSFSPMTSLYALSVIVSYTSSVYVRSRATLNTQSLMTSDLATVTLSLSDTLGVSSSSSSKTSYGLRISQDNWTSPVDIGTLPAKKLCLPYIYTAYVIPDNGLPYVEEVAPAGARDVVPGETFTIYITFSTAVYEAGTTLKAATEEAVKRAFYVYDRTSASTATNVYPDSCVQVSSDTSRWGVTFISKNFAPLVDYQLGFVEGILVDSAGEEVKYVYVNIYHTIDTTCNSHGSLNSNRTICLCDKGYAGQDCQACDIGYVNVGTGTTGKDIRCMPAMTCEEDTCGCDYEDDTYQTCNPLGECEVNSTTGLAACVCKDGYAGAFCRTCAEGWDGWPRCIPCFNGAAWDSVKNRCVCAGNFAGPKCQDCKFGYSGKNCQTYGGAVFAIILGIVIIVAAAVILAFVAWKANSSRSLRTYQRVLTTAGGEGYDDDLDDDDDDDWMSSPVPSAAREAKKQRTFAIRKADDELFSDDGLQDSINNDTDVDFFAKK